MRVALSRMLVTHWTKRASACCERTSRPRGCGTGHPDLTAEAGVPPFRAAFADAGVPLRRSVDRIRTPRGIRDEAIRCAQTPSARWWMISDAGPEVALRHPVPAHSCNRSASPACDAACRSGRVRCGARPGRR